jgi:nitrogenase subunit NifH
MRQVAIFSKGGMQKSAAAQNLTAAFASTDKKSVSAGNGHQRRI